MKKKILVLLFLASSIALVSCGSKKNSSSKCNGNGLTCPIGLRVNIK